MGVGEREGGGKGSVIRSRWRLAAEDAYVLFG